MHIKGILNIFEGATDYRTIMGVTIDSINEYIYIYAGAYDQETFRARLDGTSKEIVLPKGKIFVVYLIHCG